MNAILKLFAWSLATAVTFATLGPAKLRPHSDFGQNGEHAFAFILVGIAFGLAYRRNRPVTAAVTIVLIGVLEILQLWAPGRHARVEDFVVDAAAASVGLLLATGVEWIYARRSSPGTT
jgi:VanZ family protein